MNDSRFIGQTKAWLDKVVIGLNFCPFARLPFQEGTIRYALSEAKSETSLAQDFLQELLLLNEKPPERLATTLLIHPFVLNNFEEYLSFLEWGSEAIAEAGMEGVIQLASFHPDYVFEGEAKDAASNFTNRSPFPMIHFLREDMLEAAIEQYGATDEIPARNIALMQRLGKEKIKELLNSLS